MKHSFEIEIRETEGRQPELIGTVIQEGRAARRRREIFAPGSVTWPTSGMEILPAHRAAPETRAHPVRQSDGRLTIRAPATEALRAAVADGRKYLSVEFHAVEQRRTEGDIREITRAFVPAAALVSSPEYIQSGAEIRETDDLTERAYRWL